MKKTLLFLFIFSVIAVTAQVTNQGEPKSWSLIQEKSSFSAINLPQINLKKIKSEDDKNNKRITKPYRIAYSQPVNNSLQNTNNWTELPNGDRIWRVLFHSKDALHLSVVFDKFYIPEGANLYLYNDDRTDLQGAYTKINNNSKQKLGSWLVQGDKLWVEYYEPKEVAGEGLLSISDVMHGYRLGNNYQKGYNDKAKSLNISGDCNHDVNCPIGKDFDTKKDILKKSVGFITMPDPGNGTFVCTGSLINNTAQDKKPYFLTANHCYEREDGTTRNEALYTMRFNWISPNPVCASAANSTDATINQTINGSTLKARNESSDFMLLELNSSIPSDWDVVYAGWDKTDTNPTFEVGIHHPQGDIMKVSRDNSGATKITSDDIDIWLIGGTGAGSGDGWEIGVTEGGSSGSALFNQNGHIIGQLLGGLAQCTGTKDNNNYDLYGRFATSWEGGGNSSNRLKDWLDPNNSNPNTLDELQSVLKTNDEVLEANLLLFPNPSNGTLNVKVDNSFGKLTYDVFNVLGQNLKSGFIENNKPIDLNSLSNAIYLVRITDVERNASLTKKIVLNK